MSFSLFKNGIVANKQADPNPSTTVLDITQVTQVAHAFIVNEADEETTVDLRYGNSISATSHIDENALNKDELPVFTLRKPALMSHRMKVAINQMDDSSVKVLGAYVYHCWYYLNLAISKCVHYDAVYNNQVQHSVNALVEYLNATTEKGDYKTQLSDTAFSYLRSENHCRDSSEAPEFASGICHEAMEFLQEVYASLNYHYENFSEDYSPANDSVWDSHVIKPIIHNQNHSVIPSLIGTDNNFGAKH